MSKLHDTVRAVVREAGSVPDVPLRDDQPLYTVGLDSLDLANIIVELEDRFSVKLSSVMRDTPPGELTINYLVDRILS